MQQNRGAYWSVNPSFTTAPGNFVKVGGGVLGCRGFHSSFRATHGDVSTTMIIKPGPVMEFLMENQGVRNCAGIDWGKAKRTLKNLRITARPRNAEHKITGLSELPCNKQMFSLKQRREGTGDEDVQATEITVIRHCLAQLYAKDITPDDKQELDEALQREESEEMGEHSIDSGEAKKKWNCRHPSPVSILEPCSSNESCNSSDSVDSHNMNDSLQCSSAQSQVDSGCSTRLQSMEVDYELSDSASSTCTENFVRETGKPFSSDIYQEISGFRSMGDWILDDLVDKDMSTRHGKWLDFEIEEFEVAEKIGQKILSTLVAKVVSDLFLG